ncbi:MAG: quinone-dependent dihydroorotate dehydrogenase, partial [Bdellovibrionaceae bacterium]|nr:quinone-dependent dihydroorotate dehydrogenase [Pseudobdellovibrionaceae bacterium]
MNPWLYLKSEWAHDLAQWALPFLGLFSEPVPPEWNPLVWRGLRFPNRLGVAGGADKNADFLRAWWSLGAGFVEVGTVTPRPQGPNPGKILDRDVNSQSMWNRMGFPSAGAIEVQANLRAWGPERPSPVFVNIGKNRDTPNADAVSDYLW